MAQRVLIETKQGRLIESIIDSSRLVIRERMRARECKIVKMERVTLFWYDVLDKYTGELKHTGTLYAADESEASKRILNMYAEYERVFNRVEIQLEDEAE